MKKKNDSTNNIFANFPAKLNNVLEESDEDVYMTFHGREVDK